MEKQCYYTNPIYFPHHPKQTNPDPYVLKYRGRYYCYASGHEGVHVSVSDDLVNWEYKGYAINEAGRMDYWAPCVIYHNGLFYMYYSNVYGYEDDCHYEFLKAAVSKNPLGPFEYQKTFFDKFSIDAHVVRDTDGIFYLFYSPNDYKGTADENAGTVILVDKLLDMFTLEGKPMPVVLPTIKEEIFEVNRFGDGRDWHTLEGAFYFTRFNTAYVMYSANAYTHENYFIGYSTAPKNTCIGALKWTKYPNDFNYRPLIRRNEAVEGTGHNSVIKGPNNVDYWIAYHGRDAAEGIEEGTEQRQLRIDPLYFDGGRLVTPAPSYTQQEGPHKPLYSDGFKELGKDWSVKSGGFEAKENALHSTSTKELNVLALQKPIENYILEIDLKGQPTHMGSRYGIRLWDDGQGSYLEAILESGDQTLKLNLCERGIATILYKEGLYTDFDFSVYHNIKIKRCFEKFTIFLDEVELFSQKVHVAFGNIGLCTYYTLASFSGLSLTGYTELVGEDLMYLSRFFKSDVLVKVIQEKLVSYSSYNAALKSFIKYPDAFVQEIGFDLMGGKIEYYPVFEDKDNGIGIIAEGNNAEVFLLKKGEKQSISIIALEERTFTVRVTVRKGKAWILIGGVTIKDIELKEDINTIISLNKAALTDFSLTQI